MIYQLGHGSGSQVSQWGSTMKSPSKCTVASCYPSRHRCCQDIKLQQPTSFRAVCVRVGLGGEGGGAATIHGLLTMASWPVWDELYSAGRQSARQARCLSCRQALHWVWCAPTALSRFAADLSGSQPNLGPAEPVEEALVTKYLVVKACPWCVPTLCANAPCLTSEAISSYSCSLQRTLGYILFSPYVYI